MPNTAQTAAASEQMIRTEVRTPRDGGSGSASCVAGGSETGMTSPYGARGPGRRGACEPPRECGEPLRRVPRLTLPMRWGPAPSPTTTLFLARRRRSPSTRAPASPSSAATPRSDLPAWAPERRASASRPCSAAWSPSAAPAPRRARALAEDARGSCSPGEGWAEDDTALAESLIVSALTKQRPLAHGDAPFTRARAPHRSCTRAARRDGSRAPLLDGVRQAWAGEGTRRTTDAEK